MNPGAPRRGFTLIELMVTLAVFAILAVLAAPSFVEMRERANLRGAGDQIVSFWANAKLEAVKRNQQLSFTIRKNGTDMCMGVSTDTTGCDCFTTGACDVDQYPVGAAQAEWHGVSMVNQPTLGPTDTDDVGVAVIDPKRSYLTNASDVGGATLLSSKSRYRLRFYADRWARPLLCAPTDSPRILSDYATRTCLP